MYYKAINFYLINAILMLQTAIVEFFYYYNTIVAYCLIQYKLRCLMLFEVFGIIFVIFIKKKYKKT